MAKQPQSKPSSKTRFGWRGFVVFILSFVGLVSLVGLGFTHWTDRQLLNTNNWVKMVAPIPKDDAVATALSDYSVNRLFDSVDVDQKIADALPQQASFLAEPLSNQLEVRVKSRTKQIIQSDRFQGIWTEANRAAHKTLVDKARENTSVTPDKTKTKFNLNLSGLGGNIRDKLGNTSLLLFQNDKAAGENDNKIGLAVSLKTGFDKFKQFVKTVDFLNGILGFVAAACILWAVAITRARRRLLMILSGIVGVISLLQIIGVKAVRPLVLNQIETQSYRPAVGFVYDSLVATFQHSATLVFIASLLIFAVSFLVGFSGLTKHKTVLKLVRDLKAHKAYKELINVRRHTGKYRYPLMGSAVLVVLIILAVMSGYDWQGILRAFMLALILCAMIRLFAILPASSNRA